MPFLSKAQQKWMFVNKPEMAKQWAAKTPDFKSLPEHVKKHVVKGILKKHTGKGGPNPLIDTQIRDVGNLGKFTPTASHLPLASQQVKKSAGVKTPLQALTDPINRSLKNIIKNKSSYKEFNQSGVNPSFKTRKGGFTKQPTGN